MPGEVLQFAGSVAAVALLVLLAHWLGFSSGAKLSNEDEAREQFRLIAGGFSPVAIALDIAGNGAIARDGSDRHAILRAHGGRFVGTVLPPGTARVAQGGVLHLGTRPPLALQLGDAAPVWADTDTCDS